MPVLVDTYNVLQTVGVLPPALAGVDTAGLAALILKSRYRAEDVRLICDGTRPDNQPRGRVSGGLSVHYAGPGNSADDLIAEIVRTSTDPRRLTVVSSDGAVIRHAKTRKCKTVSSVDFLETLARDNEVQTIRPGSQAPAHERGPGPLSEKQVNSWMKQFGIDGSEIGGLSSQIEAEARKMAAKAMRAAGGAGRDAARAKGGAARAKDHAARVGDDAALAADGASEESDDAAMAGPDAADTRSELAQGISLPADLLGEAARLLKEFDVDDATLPDPGEATDAADDRPVRDVRDRKDRSDK